MTKTIFYALLFLSLCIFTSCAKQGSGLKTESVEGIVTLDGQPLEKVQIRFIPKTEGIGEEAGGVSDKQGVYRLSSLRGDPGKGALEGEYLVTAAKSEAVELPKPKIDPATGDPVTHELKSVLPAIYNDKTKTPLSATIVRGKNKIDIKLESSTGKP